MQNEIKNRIKETISCKDCDYIPKRNNAGQVVKDENGNYIQFMHNGVKIIEGCYHNWMTQVIKKLKGHHEPQEEKVFYEILKNIKPNSTMIELGSNWAYYSLWFNMEVQHANNYLVEPIKSKLLVGQKNFELNSMEGTFLSACIGSEYKDETDFEDWDGQFYKMPSVSVDYLVNKYKIKFVAILHSDIQGAECEMLNGCIESIKSNKIGFFIISTHGNEIHKECIEFLEKNNFIIIAEHNQTESFSADGLVAAASNQLDFKKHIDISRKTNPTSWIDKLKAKIRF